MMAEAHAKRNAQNRILLLLSAWQNHASIDDFAVGDTPTTRKHVYFAKPLHLVESGPEKTPPSPDGGNYFGRDMALRATPPTTPAPRVHRSMARWLRAAASASPFSTLALQATRTATAQATESTRKLKATLRVVLVQASVFSRPLPCLSGERRNGHVQLNTFAMNSTPRVNRPMARRLRAAASKSSSSTAAPPAMLMATHSPPSQRAHYKHRFWWS